MTSQHVIKSTPGAGGAARSGGAAPPPDETMTKTTWTTVAIPTELYDEIRAHLVPSRAKSVQAYVNFWVRAGTLIDRTLAATPDHGGDLLGRILQTLQAMDKKP